MHWLVIKSLSLKMLLRKWPPSTYLQFASLKTNFPTFHFWYNHLQFLMPCLPLVTEEFSWHPCVIALNNAMDSILSKKIQMTIFFTNYNKSNCIDTFMKTNVRIFIHQRAYIYIFSNTENFTELRQQFKVKVEYY